MLRRFGTDNGIGLIGGTFLRALVEQLLGVGGGDMPREKPEVLCQA